jgi:thiamine transporter ThiT
MLIASAVLLPMAFHSIVGAGGILLPMHIPVLLAGLVCGWKFGLIAGLIAPIISHMITGMPAPFMIGIMTVELAVYGLVAGIMSEFVRTRRASVDLYISLIVAMLVGRVVAGLVLTQFFFDGMPPFITGGEPFSFSLWISMFFVTALPGIAIQLCFIPSVVMALEREKVIPMRYPIAPIAPVTQ